MNREIEFAIVEDADISPIVITIGDNDVPKLVLNQYYRVWISLNRKVIAGIFESMPKQIDKMLDQILQEQRNFEINDGDDMYGV